MELENSILSKEKQTQKALSYMRILKLNFQISVLNLEKLEWPVSQTGKMSRVRASARKKRQYNIGEMKAEEEDTRDEDFFKYLMGLSDGEDERVKGENFI